ncbi:unnamed protein product [Rotaria sordida]|uniref:Uncharacterized protein n=2 Tax=Rotaria sordida TaxID=392033 RepID=A0A819HB74_9BILA|nr:unnamed protein product [Rotaria sordida]
MTSEADVPFNSISGIWVGEAQPAEELADFFIPINPIQLHVDVDTFTDCLYLLNGRFSQLHTLYVNIDFICTSDLIVNNREKLFNLKYFSLYSNDETNSYDELILPLLQRMSNLEKFHLYFVAYGRKTFFDDNELNMNIIDYMPLLSKFTFNIRSFSPCYNQINLPSNEDIQKTFRDFKDQQIIYCANYFSMPQYGECHLYSYPYQLQHYDRITNNFPGGIFTGVCKVSLWDKCPFEHEFFLRIT